MKLSLLTLESNLNIIYNHSESAARGTIESFILNNNKSIINLHTHLTTQYIIQFSIQKFVKPNSSINQDHYKKIINLLSKLTIEKIKTVNHEAVPLAQTASKSLSRLKREDLYSIVWMIDQLGTLSDLLPVETRKLFPDIANSLDASILKCIAFIKKTKFKNEGFQEDFFENNSKDAAIDQTPNRKRNVVVNQ